MLEKLNISVSTSSLNFKTHHQNQFSYQKLSLHPNQHNKKCATLHSPNIIKQPHTSQRLMQMRHQRPLLQIDRLRQQNLQERHQLVLLHAPASPQPGQGLQVSRAQHQPQLALGVGEQRRVGGVCGVERWGGEVGMQVGSVAEGL